MKIRVNVRSKLQAGSRLNLLHAKGNSLLTLDTQGILAEFLDSDGLTDKITDIATGIVDAAIAAITPDIAAAQADATQAIADAAAAQADASQAIADAAAAQAAADAAQEDATQALSDAADAQEDATQALSDAADAQEAADAANAYIAGLGTETLTTCDPPGSVEVLTPPA